MKQLKHVTVILILLVGKNTHAQSVLKYGISYLNYRQVAKAYNSGIASTPIINTASYINLNMDVAGSILFTKKPKVGKPQFKDYAEVGFGVGFGPKSIVNDANVNGRLLIVAGGLLQYQVNEKLLVGAKAILFGYDAYIGTKNDAVGFVNSNMLYPFVQLNKFWVSASVGILQPSFTNNTYNRVDLEVRYFFKGGNKKFAFARFQNINHSETYVTNSIYSSTTKLGNGILSFGLSL
jgi:hypothetical protein